MQEEIKLVRCNRIDSLHTVLTTQIKSNKITKGPDLFRRNICISDQEIDEKILQIFVKAMGVPYKNEEGGFDQKFAKNEEFSYVLFVDNVEKVNYKNFHVKEGVELITS